MTFILTSFFAAVGLALHARRLPPQNLVAIALLIFGSATAFEWSAKAWGIPFQPVHLNGESFWCLPLGWIGTILFSRKTAQFLLRSQHNKGSYGFWMLGLTMLMSAAFWAVIEIVLAQLNSLNFIGRLFVSSAILLVIFPWLIEKRPRTGSSVASAQ